MTPKERRDNSQPSPGMTLHVLRPMTARKKCKREPEDEISSGCYCLSAPIIMQPDWRKALARLDAHWSTKTK